MAKKTPSQSGNWFSKANMLQVFDVSEQVFDRNIRVHFPKDCTRQDDKRRLAFYARGCIDAYAARRANNGEDPLLVSAGSSPALERYREERAQLARLDRLERERVLLPRHEMHLGLGRMGALIRALGMRFQKIGPFTGAEAHTMLEETLADFEHEMDALFGELPHEPPTPPAPAPDPDRDEAGPADDPGHPRGAGQPGGRTERGQRPGRQNRLAAGSRRNNPRVDQDGPGLAGADPGGPGCDNQ